jgi:hypothetical protein
MTCFMAWCKLPYCFVFVFKNHFICKIGFRKNNTVNTIASSNWYFIDYYLTNINMIGPKYIETSSDLIKYRERSLDVHIHKLSQIRSGNARLDNSPPRSQRIKSTRNKTLKFHQSEHKNSVTKDNAFMLDKLVKINGRKLSQTFRENFGPKSMNNKNRRDEIKRI